MFEWTYNQMPSEAPTWKDVHSRSALARRLKIPRLVRPIKDKSNEYPSAAWKDDYHQEAYFTMITAGVDCPAVDGGIPSHLSHAWSCQFFMQVYLSCMGR